MSQPGLRWLTGLFACAGLLLGSPALAQAPYLVKDLNTQLVAGNPVSLAVADGTVFFVAADSADGRALFRSDGTAAGTERLASVNPPAAPIQPTGEACELTAVGRTVFFFQGGADRAELWKSDGTAAGTGQVVATTPSTVGPSHALTGVNGMFFFASALDLNFRYELWRSDGTAAGTMRIPGTPVLTSLEFAAIADTLYFVGSDPAAGQELWKTDGTQAVRVADMNPGPNGSTPRFLTAVGSTLFFEADDVAHGPQLWRSD